MPRSNYFSERCKGEIFLKFENMQRTGSFKIRGAFNKLSSLTDAEKRKGVVACSAGNHAQGVAYSCSKLGIRGRIFMPVTTPKQKIDQVRMFGGDQVEVVLVGDTFDAANQEAIAQCERDGMVFIPPFDDPKIIEGQGTVALRSFRRSRSPSTMSSFRWAVADLSPEWGACSVK